MIEAVVVGPQRVAYTAAEVGAPLGLWVRGVRRARDLSRLRPPPPSCGRAVTLVWCPSVAAGDVEPLREYLEVLGIRRGGLVVVGVPSRPMGPVEMMLSSKPTGHRTQRRGPLPDELPALLGVPVVECDGGPHAGLRRFLRCFAEPILAIGTGSVRATDEDLAAISHPARAGRLLTWRVDAENEAAGQWMCPARGSLAPLRDPRVTGVLVHLRCPEPVTVESLQQTAEAIEELVPGRARGVISTALGGPGLGGIEVHAVAFRPASRMAPEEATGARRGRVLRSPRRGGGRRANLRAPTEEVELAAAAVPASRRR